MAHFWRGKQRSYQQVHLILYYFAETHCIPSCFGRWGGGRGGEFQLFIWENPKDTFPHTPFLHGHSVLPYGATRSLWEHLESPTAHCQQEMKRKNLFLHISVNPMLICFQQFLLPLFLVHFYDAFSIRSSVWHQKETCLGKGATEKTHRLFI